MNRTQTVTAALISFLIQRVNANPAWTDTGKTTLARALANATQFQLELVVDDGDPHYILVFSVNDSVFTATKMKLRDGADTRAALMSILVPVAMELLGRTPQTMPVLDDMFIRHFKLNIGSFVVTFDSDWAEFNYCCEFPDPVPTGDAPAAEQE